MISRLLLILSLFVAAPVFAQVSLPDINSREMLKNKEWLAAWDADNQSLTGILRRTGSDTELNVVSGGTGKLQVAKTSVLTWDVDSVDAVQSINMSAQKNVKLAAYVPTMAATAVAGTNQILPGLNIVPTAAANTVALTRATPIVGEEFEVWNSNGTNAVRIKAGGASKINGSAAGAYVELAALAGMKCRTVGAADHLCTSLTTVAMATPA